MQLPKIALFWQEDFDVLYIYWGSWKGYGRSSLQHPCYQKVPGWSSSTLDNFSQDLVRTAKWKKKSWLEKNSKVSEVTWCSLTNSTPMTIWKGLKFVPPHLYGLTRYSYKPWEELRSNSNLFNLPLLVMCLIIFFKLYKTVHILYSMYGMNF